MEIDPMIEGRIGHVRDICNKALQRDGRFTDRAWLAQSVINILDGLIDTQIVREINVGGETRGGPYRNGS